MTKIPPINPGIAEIQKRGSRIITEGKHMLPAASLMIAAGAIEHITDRKRPYITIINSYSTHIPGHAHLDVLGQRLTSLLKGKGYNIWCANIGAAVCDGIAMGHFGMKYSLPSRELITDQIETIIGAHPCDAWIGIGNCDKIVPGMLNAMARLDIPSLYLSGGPMLAGKDNTDLVTVFEGVGKEVAGEIDEKKLIDEDFLDFSITEFYISNFLEENLNLLSDRSSILYFGEKRKTLNRYNFNCSKYSEGSAYGSLSFDCVIFSEAIKYLDRMEYLLKQFYKLLKSGGILLTTVPFIIGNDIRNLDELECSYDWISKKLWEIGFREVSVKKMGTEHSLSLYLEYKNLEMKLEGTDGKKAAVMKNKFIKKKLKNVLMLENRSHSDRGSNSGIITTGYGIAAIK